MFEVIIENIVKIVFAVVLAAISIGGQAITDQLKNKLKLRNIQAAQQELVYMARQTVCELEQTTVKELKAATADGKLTVDDVKHLGAELVKKTLEKMCEPAINLLNAAGVDITALIHGAAEDYILGLK